MKPSAPCASCRSCSSSPSLAVIRLTLTFASVNACTGAGGNHAPCSSQPSLTSMTIAWSFDGLLPNSTAMRATIDVGRLEDQPEDLQPPVDAGRQHDLDRRLRQVVGLDLVAALQHRAAQAEATVRRHGRQPGRHRQREVLQHELEVRGRLRCRRQRATSCLIGSRAWSRSSVRTVISPVPSLPSPPTISWRRPLEREVVLGVAAERRVRQEAEVVNAAARQAAEAARPDGHRHRRLDRHLALFGEPHAQVHEQRRRGQLAQHDLEAVVDAGLERPGLHDVEQAGAFGLGTPRGAAASAGRWAAASRPAGPRRRLRRRRRTSVANTRAGRSGKLGCSTNAKSGSWRSTSGGGFGCGSITSSAAMPTRSAAAPGRTAAKRSTVCSGRRAAARSPRGRRSPVDSPSPGRNALASASAAPPRRRRRPPAA